MQVVLRIRFRKDFPETSYLSPRSQYLAATEQYRMSISNSLIRDQ